MRTYRGLASQGMVWRGIVWRGIVSLVVVAGALIASPAPASAATTDSWPSAGRDLANTRSNPNETAIGPSTVAGLTLKWSVGFSSTLAATPAVADGLVFMADRAGNLSAFDAVTGAVKWSHTVSSYTGVGGYLGRATPAVANGRVIFGDLHNISAPGGVHVIAVSETTGDLLWKTTIDTTPTAKMTGAVTVDGNTVYAGISSDDESSSQCCTFRGSVVALDATTGAIEWKTYTVPTGYTGGAVWGSAPVVDHTTGLLYVGTGNNYTVPAGVCAKPGQTGCTAPASNDYIDSLLALNLTTGAVTWVLRTLGADLSTDACGGTTTCGPDWDFASAPNEFTATVGGVSRRLVGIGQKSGIYWTVDAATGQLVWSTQVGPGGGTGGVMWGSATDGQRIYVAINNSEHKTYKLINGTTTTGGAWSALDPATGKILWQTADPQGVGDFGFVSVANGVVYAGSGAGSGNNMFAFNAATGAILWRFASNGSVMGGAAIVDGVVYWAAGYYTKYCPSGTTCGTTYKLYAFTVAPSTLPSKPTLVGMSQTASTRATIWWQPPTSSGSGPITYYRVMRKGTDSLGVSSYTTKVSASTRSFVFNNLVAGRTYTLAVAALNAAGQGSIASGTVTISTAALPGAPSSFAAKQTAAGAATMTWSPPASSGGGTITGYRVSRDGTDKSGVLSYSTVVSASTRSFTMSNLVVGSTYHLSVQAITTVGTGPAATGAVTITF